NINPEMRVKCAQGSASPELSEQGWRQFLVKVVNEAGTTAPLRIESVNAQPVSNADSVNPRRRARRGEGAPVAPKEISELWLELQSYDSSPLKPTLSGLAVEYRILQLYSRDAGKREARFTAD